MASGLVLFTYALLHFLNIGLGLFSSELMERAQDWRQVITRSWPGTILIYGALLTHAGLALYKLAKRSTLRMPLWEATQIALGLIIPILLIAHIVYTRFAHELFSVNDDFAYLVTLIFGSPDGWMQSLLLLIVWVHACIGLHFWLRSEPWWQRLRPVLTSLSVLIPGFALVGFLTEGRRAVERIADPDMRAALIERINWPDSDAMAALLRIENIITVIFWILLAAAAGTYLVRKLLRRRKSVRIRYVNGPEIVSPKGPTLLEMSRANGVAHTSLCGGRGRCTTCRVLVEDGAENLAPPSEAEKRSLAAVGAAPGMRLACQIRPTAPLTVYRVFRPDGKRRRAHASQGQERRMAILFLDIRGFTARTTGQLPYDVVFLLNRFFDAIVPAITATGGVVDKYLGDGLLALFETPDEASSAQAALSATTRIGEALEEFNRTLADEGAPEVRIGIGLHLGEVVLGEIGAAGNAPRTIIGETVNAASRLEAMTKEMGVEVLVSAPVLTSAGIETEHLEMVKLELRGVNLPVPSLAVTRAAHLQSALTPTN
ncbi:adenylate/guanylate cyclase domain-containing protein [Phaeobacter sp. 22II1-1F12B]|uniref:adenylate/guanylate cyclase domain-containing protein n=1 Tax=Phaeobacter sp. 22II1-1F12B TaxID=1317111 RepID=UPI000B5285E3|nr:adenylate/guanylate cyclase domain-containing protein [Phaeobacter sp. 22II1-1F12B]